MSETVRKESTNSFELDPAHYLSTPGYSWDGMLRFIDVNLKLISGTGKYKFIKKHENRWYFNDLEGLCWS